MATYMKLQERDGPSGGGRGYEEGLSERVNEGDGVSEVGKVLRKRGHNRARRASSVCSSVRGSSIAIKSGLRLKRASQLVGKRRGPSTPVPSWKLVGGVESKEAQLHYHHYHHHQTERPSAATISARRLAATLWELQPLPFSRGGVPRSGALHHDHCNKSPSTAEHPGNHAPSQVGAVRATIPSIIPPSNMKALWKDLTQGPATSDELLKVLNHVRSLEEQHKSSALLVESLHSELNEARMQLQELMQNEKDHRLEVEDITKKLVEERIMWQERQEESVGLAVQSMKEELYYERKAKSRLESLHRRMAKELRELKKALGKALHDLERERKARELMEDVCDELAREIGEDKARVEEMKRESAKVREEVEEERKMLQMAEVWREERVQMKLMEAKLELEEKNTALDKLRGELEAFLKAKRAANTGNYVAVNVRKCGLKGHAKDAVISRDVADPFHLRESRVPAQHSFDSQLSNVSGPKMGLEGLEEDEGSMGEEDFHASAISNDTRAKQEATQRSRFQYHHKEIDERNRQSGNRRHSNSEQSKQWQGDRYQVLQRSRSSQMKESSGHTDHYLADMQGTQWVDDNEERHHTKEQSEDLQQSTGDGGQEETTNSWLSENEGACGHSSFSPRSGGRKQAQYEETAKPKLSGKNAAWLRQMVESSRDFPVNSVFTPMHQYLYTKSSPTRHWSHFLSSPDPVSPRQGKGKGGSSEMWGGPRGKALK